MNGPQQMASAITRLCAACAFSAATLAWSYARADETTNALLDLLKAKGAITQSEYDKIKARQQAESKDSAQKLQAAETRAREAEAKAREAKAELRAMEIAPKPATNQAQGGGNAVAQADGQPASNNTLTEAQTRAMTLSAADQALPTKAPLRSPVEYVTVLPNCVGIRVGEVDICTKGDVSFFGVENFPDKNPVPPTITGGLANADPNNAAAIRGGLLPSSIALSLATHQAGMDIGVYLGVYTGGNNVFPQAANANSGGSPIGLGTPGIDFRQFYGTIGTPTWGSVKIGRDIGLFAADAILNDLTLFGVGSVPDNAAPTNTSLGRIGLGYIYADWLPQITYKSPTIGGFTGYVSLMTPLDALATNPFFGAVTASGSGCAAVPCLVTASSGDPTTSELFTGHDAPMVQGKLSYVNAFSPDAKLTLSTSGLWQRQLADCTGANLSGGLCVLNPVVAGSGLALPVLNHDAVVDAWAVDGFAMLDLWGWNFVAYGYTGKGVGTTGLFFNGIDAFGDARRSDGGYFQAAYTFNEVFTVGGSWGVSHLETANGIDNDFVFEQCTSTGPLGSPMPPNTSAGTSCLVKDNSSWIGFARYKLTKWVNLQAEYVATTAKNQIGQSIRNDAIVAGTTFFW
ncbi:MAG TPA: porin [Xanthobacteraceae bacterium]|jgi:predicted porin